MLPFQMDERFSLLQADFLRALERLDEALAQPEDAFIRDALIQRFEFTFELAWKAMQRFLQAQGLAAGTPRQTLRLAPRAGLLVGDDEVAAWLEMLDDRNLTSHTYREALAAEIADAIRTRHIALLHAFATRVPSLLP